MKKKLAIQKLISRGVPPHTFFRGHPARYAWDAKDSDGALACIMCEESFPCVCTMEDKDGKEYWLAHCMNCNWSLSKDGHMGSRETSGKTEEEAISKWNEINYRPPPKPRRRKE